VCRGQEREDKRGRQRRKTSDEEAEKKWYVNKEERLTRRPEEHRPRKRRGRVKLI